jgi:outer membrane immunogenic protein
MRKALLGSASAVALSCAAALPAYAASPVYSWTGFYIGGNIGGGVGSSDPSLIANITAAPFFNTNNLSTPSLSVEGFAGGGQAGYNFQTGNYVYGFETDFTGMNVRGSSAESPFFTGKGQPNTVTWSSRYSWLYTARLRAGLTMGGNWLIYGTGGVAVTSVRDMAMCTSPATGCGDIGPFSPQSLQWAETSTLTGFTFGGGIEGAFLQNWIFGLKVLYAKFPNTSPNFIGVNTAGSGAVPAAFSYDHSLTLVTFVVDYKFGGP